MYSYGSSARAGVAGKRGHGGGRPYRPPRKRRDPNSAPPPLKECSCLVEIHLAEYRAPQPMGRHHVCFGGRQAMEQCERTLRSDYQVHLMVPGKKQQGPVSVVAKTIQEALPALAWLLENLQQVDDSSPRSIPGRIHRNVKDPQVSILNGAFPLAQDLSMPYWLFQSPEWAVLGCKLLLDNDNGEGENKRALELQTCLDNIIFRLGKEAVGLLHIMTDPYQEYCFAVGNPDQAKVLCHEMSTAFQQQQSTTEDQKDNEKASKKKEGI